ncbi:MAG: alpha/beta fold hydrolase [Firmicutes bacterium]|nr:alpha/beta fold hydrolase [Bacillota bacterium]
MKNLKKGKSKIKMFIQNHIVIVSILVLMIIYYSIIRRFLIPSMSTVTIELLIAGIAFVIVLYFLIALLITGIITGIKSFNHKNKDDLNPWKKRLIKKTKLVLISICFLVLITLISQYAAYTPPILDGSGNQIENSIATMEKVTINNSEQYLTIRGHDKDNPVILFLAGGPGGTQLAATRDVLKDLEKNFVVVNWEQPGSSKSFKAVPIDELSPEKYIEDGHGLTTYLKKRFNKEKIYVVGQSWGSALGIWLAEKYPEDYHVYIGSGQMVSFLDTEIYCYNKALEIAEKKGDTNTVKKLKEQGKPPYAENVSMQSATYLTYLFQDMARNPNINHTDHNTFKDIAGPEYGLWDKVNYFRALIVTFDQVYPQLYDIDFRKEVTEFEIPIYILHGRYDVNAPTEFVEEYYKLIKAPYKELIWFEHSGHDNWIDESDLFIEILNDIQKQEYR